MYHSMMSCNVSTIAEALYRDTVVIVDDLWYHIIKYRIAS